MTVNKYLFKAMDAYPFELEETIEALEYALSYERNNTTALCLMGRLQAEKLQNYEAAKEYYLEALAENPCAIEVFPHYISVLLWNEDFVEAGNFITFALKVKGADKGTLYIKKAYLHEYQQQYNKALKALKKAACFTYNKSYMDFIKEQEERIKAKKVIQEKDEDK